MPKTTLIVEFDSEARKILEKRAKKKFMTIRELVTDILRRSVISSQGKYKEKKTGDIFVNIFSKSRRGRKAKKKK